MLNRFSIFLLSASLTLSALSLPAAAQNLFLNPLPVTVGAPASGQPSTDISGTVTSGGSYQTVAAGEEIVALRLTDPVLIQSGSGTDYVVSGDQTRAEQTYNVAQILLPGGTDGTTATYGSTVASYNGTARAYGEKSIASNNQWSATAAFLGNRETIDADTSGNYDIQTAGSGGEIKFDGVGLNGPMGVCPGANPP